MENATDVLNATASPLTVQASVKDGGTPSYQWYRHTPNSNSGGTPISSATGPSLTPSTNAVGTVYYYAVVTNTNNEVNGNKTATAVSSVAAVTVVVIPPDVDMVFVPGGSFEMGKELNPASGYGDQTPHTVTLSGFYMGRTEVTQELYQAVMGTNPSNYRGDNLPVETVSWYDAVEFCNALSEREDLTPAYTVNGTDVTWNRNATGYRLPTEAQWEYAAKGGDPLAPGWVGYTYAGSNDPDEVAWHSGNSGSRTHEVGTKAANGLGLYDMIGNVWEWCWDWYDSYSSEPQTNPGGASSGSDRVLRGGYWYDSAEFVRSAFRSISDPDYRSNSVGFRLVRP
jgi:formylglycine-generating enzyme required for sulfatase activity